MSDFLKDHNGNNSSMRLFVGIWLIGVLGAWMFIVVVTRTLPDLPTSIAGIVVAAFGAKIGQKMVEVNSDKPKDTAP